MAMFIPRYDMRAPVASPASAGDLYACMLDQAAWAEENGFDMLVLSEHHGVEDGYLPAPLTLAAAVTGRTKTLPVTISALLVPLHDPVRLAEQMVVVDHTSGGRVSYVAGLGYRPVEYEMADADWKGRGALIEECLAALKQAFTGEPFEYRGRTVQVTPTPFTKPHPTIFYGGMSKAAARRAARLDLAFFPQITDPALAEVYQQARAEAGLGPGLVMQPSQDAPGTVFVADDPDAAWAEIGTYLLYEARVYHSWQQSGVTSAVHDASETVEQMRAAGVYQILTPDECVALAERLGPMGAITTHPLCGGIPPEISWKYLRNLGEVATSLAG